MQLGQPHQSLKYSQADSPKNHIHNFDPLMASARKRAVLRRKKLRRLLLALPVELSTEVLRSVLPQDEGYDLGCDFWGEYNPFPPTAKEYREAQRSKRRRRMYLLEPVHSISRMTRSTLAQYEHTANPTFWSSRKMPER